jgi:hypothetical protein
MRSLSSREVEGNGPMKPGNPLVFARRVPIPADYAFRKMRGLSKNAQPLECRGFFMPSKNSSLPKTRCSTEDIYPYGYEMERKEFANEQFYA